MAVVKTEKVAAPPARAGGRFWRGVVVGVFGVVFLVSAFVYYTLNVRGFSIFIDQEKLAVAVRAKVRARVAQELPVVLDKIMRDATSHILSEGDGPRLVVEIGDKRLELPGETVSFLQVQLRSAAETSLQDSLARFDLSPYANELAEEAYSMVQRTLAEEVYGRTFRFQANRWLSLPVIVQGAPD